MIASKLGARVFSGIQPTGIPHLGNYFGAISPWIKLCKGELNLKESGSSCDDNLIFSIVDVHAYSSTSKRYGEQLYNNILSTTASLIALGLDTSKCILFRQSDLLEHFYLHSVLDNFITTNRLKQMIQYKQKKQTDSTNALLNYPVLQAADILLYKANYVPVGEDQVQHIELTRDLARKFNAVTQCHLFPDPMPILDTSVHARRIKSLRDPTKKMSKSDVSQKSFIQVIDKPDVIVEKCKKAMTDSTGLNVTYDPVNRPGVTNLVNIYHLASGDSIENVCRNHAQRSVAEFKAELADLLVELFKSARCEFERLRKDHDHLESVLESGAQKAKPLASETIVEVKNLLGSKMKTIVTH